MKLQGCTSLVAGKFPKLSFKEINFLAAKRPSIGREVLLTNRKENDSQLTEIATLVVVWNNSLFSLFSFSKLFPKNAKFLDEFLNG